MDGIDYILSFGTYTPVCDICLVRPGKSASLAGMDSPGRNVLFAAREAVRRQQARDYTGTETTIWLSTSVTPGADQAVSSAAFFSA